MRRLHKLTPEQIEQWRQERFRVGQQRYGDSDLQRYNLVDVVEELLDVINITQRMENRWINQNYKADSLLINDGVERLKNLAEDMIWLCQLIDERIPEAVCSDEQGGERIWWND